ncbi:helix-turn-helix domain-containing protein [Nocardia transvalensis]|uniref:helix-turn-helix domain-containing protein n=1 Tax=Nocardia transvalensis TaxID=37333 RepID=UPI001892FBD1|nr:helix-turn-helix transcriptional regulator [Nocardia transvalensis]MBF6333342.1 helix-turn-helix transcriptional regulator [Nocardia transvalensis]
MDQTRAIWDTADVRAAVRSGDPGAVVRAVRRAHGLTLADLAKRTNYSASNLSRLERGKQQLSDIRVLRCLAEALHMPAELLGLADTPLQPVHERRPAAMVGISLASDEETNPMRRRTLLTGLTSLASTAVLGTSASAMPSADPFNRLEHALLLPPTDGIPTDPARIEHDLAVARSIFHQGRYTDVADRLPRLLATTIATRGEGRNSDDIAAASSLLAQVYTLASKLTVKLGRDQLAWTTADRATQAAHGSDDILSQAAADRAWAIALRRTGHADTGQRLIIDTATGLQPELHRGPHYLAMYGSLLATAAYTAAVDGHRDTAHTLIGEAVDAAARLDDNDSHTGFGPAAVAVYRISMARVLGDSGTAIEAARLINPSTIPLIENRARYWSDVARSFHQWGKHEQCYRALLAAEHASPDEVRYRKPIQQITIDLLRRPATRTLPGLRAFAKRNGVMESGAFTGANDQSR